MAQSTITRPLPKIILLSLLLYRCLLSLGPRAFRRDYAAPALQDFRQCCRDAYQQQGAFGVLRLWPGLIGETVPGLLAEYWTELFGRRNQMLPAVRRSMVAVFWAFVLFLFAFIALVRTADPVAPFNAVAHLHPEIAITHTLFSDSGVAAFLAILLGGLPMLFISVKHAFVDGPIAVLKLFLIKPKQALLLLAVALIITVCFVTYLLGTEYLFGAPTTQCPAAQQCLGQQSPGMVVLNLVAIIVSITLGVFVVLAISASLSLTVLRSEYSKGTLQFALAPIGMLALTMGTATLASAIWTFRLWIDAPQFAASDAGLGNGQTAWVIVIVAAMAVSTVVTAGAFISGLRASQFSTIA
jgi:hypothetical protein